MTLIAGGCMRYARRRPRGRAWTGAVAPNSDKGTKMQLRQVKVLYCGAGHSLTSRGQSAQVKDRISSSPPGFGGAGLLVVLSVVVLVIGIIPALDRDLIYPFCTASTDHIKSTRIASLTLHGYNSSGTLRIGGSQSQGQDEAFRMGIAQGRNVLCGQRQLVQYRLRCDAR